MWGRSVAWSIPREQGRAIVEILGVPKVDSIVPEAEVE